MTFHCVCDKTVEYPGVGSYNVGEAEQATGWFYVILSDGRCTWLCPECQTQVFDLVRQLASIFGHKDAEMLYFPGLMRGVK
jgi:hypothetical protein